MNPVTLRRLLVFGVCAVGVGMLYLVPALAGPSGQVAAPKPDDEPISQPASTASTATSSVSPAGRGTTRPDPAASSPTTTSSAGESQDASVQTSRRARPSSGGATAYDPRDSTDRVAPTPVTAISTGPVTRDRVTVSWPPASDDVGVLRYRVVLNGFTVATTRSTHATVRWFNDDLGTHVIQVRALDAAGNESPTSPNLLVSRPTQEPTPAPSPSSTPSEPSPTPSATASSPQPSTVVTPNEVGQPEGASSSPGASASTGGS